MVKVKEALDIVLRSVHPLGPEEVPIIDTLGRILKEDICANQDIPPFDNSAMDGYAVLSCDVKKASRKNPAILDVVADLPAGSYNRPRITKGLAARIMTGAPIPPGADSVIMVENTRLAGGKVKVFASVEPGENVREAGEDIKRGESVLKKGHAIGPAQMGILSSLGIKGVKVAKPPRVGILATGDELVRLGGDIAPGKIRDSNTYSLYGQVKKAGGMPYSLGIARDNKTEIRAKLKKGLSCDLLLISGGVSVGDYDYVKSVLEEMDIELKFSKVAMKPGKPVVFGLIKGKPVFGLPGNPVSSMVSFELFVRPVISKMLGKEDTERDVEAVLEEDIKKKRGFRYFLRAETRWKNGLYLTRTTGPQGSGILKSMALANSLIVLPETKGDVEKGSMVTVRFL